MESESRKEGRVVNQTHLETLIFSCKSIRMALNDMIGFIENGEFAKAAFAASNLSAEIDETGKLLTWFALLDNPQEVIGYTENGFTLPHKQNPELIAENERLLEALNASSPDPT